MESITRRWLRRGALALLGLTIFVLAATAIAVGRLETHFSTHLWAQNRWPQNGEVGLRVATFDPADRRFLEGFSVRVSLEDRAGQTFLLFDEGTELPALSKTITLPSGIRPGPGRLRVATSRGEAQDHLEVEIVFGGTSEKPPPASAKPPRVRPWRATLRPSAGVAVGELKQRWLLRVVDNAGRPAAGEQIALKLVSGRVDGLPAAVALDSAGLASFFVTPRFHELRFEFSKAGSDHVEAVRLQASPAAFVMGVGSVLLPPTQALSFSLDSLHSNSTVYADAYQEGVWRRAQTSELGGGVGTLRFSAPQQGGVLWLQAYRSFLAPGRARVRRALWVSPDPVAGLAALLDSGHPADRMWLGQVRAAGLPTSTSDAERLAAFVLARLPGGPPPPPLLKETASSRQAELGAYQDTVRSRVVGVLGGMGGLLVLVLAFMLFEHQRGMKRQSLLLEEGQLAGRSALLESVVLLLTVAFAIVGLLVLLDGLRWY